MKLIKKLNIAINRKQKARKALIKQIIAENKALLKIKAAYLDLHDLLDKHGYVCEECEDEYNKEKN